MHSFSPEKFRDGEVLLIDKDLEWSSFDIVNKVRVLLRQYLDIPKIKVGHAGTLDPLATGLVILCTGKATKQIESFMGMEKEYVAEITFGATTPSFDLETEIDQTFPVGHITREGIAETLKSFTGDFLQAPPQFSAKQVKGKRAYQMARDGEKFTLNRNLVCIHENEILNFDSPVLQLRVRCGKGTYIRSLANDLGFAMDSGAHLTGLRRTHIGKYHVNDALKISDFEKKLKPL